MTDRDAADGTGARTRERTPFSAPARFIQGSGIPGLGSGWGPGGVYYVRITPDTIVVRDVRGRRQIEEVPQAALDAAGRVVAVGREAGHLSGQGDLAAGLRSPFARSSLDVGDVDLAAGIVRHLVRGLRRVPWVPVMIRGMIIHPDFAAADPLSTDERDAFIVMAKRAGARTAQVWEGRPLADDEVLDAIVPPAYRL